MRSKSTLACFVLVALGHFFPVLCDKEAGCSVLNSFFEYESLTRYRTALFPLPVLPNNTLFAALESTENNQLTFIHGTSSIHLEYALHNFCVEKRDPKKRATLPTHSARPSKNEKELEESCAFLRIDTATIMARAMQNQFDIDQVLRRYFRLESVGEFLSCLPKSDRIFIILAMDFFSPRHKAVLDLLEQISQRSEKIRVVFGARTTTAFFKGKELLEGWKVFDLEKEEFREEAKKILLEWPKENRAFKKRYLTTGDDNGNALNIDRVVSYFDLDHLGMALDYGGQQIRSVLLDPLLKTLNKLAEGKTTKRPFRSFQKRACEVSPFIPDQWKTLSNFSNSSPVPLVSYKSLEDIKDLDRILEDLVQSRILDTHPSGIGFVSEFDHEVFCGFAFKETSFEVEIKEAEANKRKEREKRKTRERKTDL